MSSTINHIIPHILSHLSSPPPSRSVTRTNPIFIALQGPQGSGKTYLSSLLLNYLSSHPYNLKLATLSIDDLYLPYSGLQQLRNAHPRDRLLEGRGLPGTHDLALGRQVLDGLKRINDSEDEEKQVLLPIFDKSLHSGFGDRLPLTPTRSRNLTGPIDIVLMEGWCVGFSTISQSELEQRWETMSEEMKGWCRAEHVMDVNERLEAYEELWKFFDVFIQIKPPSPQGNSSPYSIIYKWRLEQEHYMKAHNGGMGMTDEEVVSFVDRYIPGYIFFSDGITRGPSTSSIPETAHNPPRWLGKSLKITIDEKREYVGQEIF